MARKRVAVKEIAQAKASGEKNNKIQNEEETEYLKENKKKKIMWFAISIIMILLAVFWILNLRIVFSKEKNKISDENKIELQSVVDEFSQNLANIKNSLNELQKQAVIENEKDSLEDNDNFKLASSTLPQSELKGESASTTINDLKENLKIKNRK